MREFLNMGDSKMSRKKPTSSLNVISSIILYLLVPDNRHSSDLNCSSLLHSIGYATYFSTCRLFSLVLCTLIISASLYPPFILLDEKRNLISKNINYFVLKLVLSNILSLLWDKLYSSMIQYSTLSFLFPMRIEEHYFF